MSKYGTDSSSEKEKLFELLELKLKDTQLIVESLKGDIIVHQNAIKNFKNELTFKTEEIQQN